MLKDNGRLKPASKTELASLKKDRSMYCSKCKEYKTISKVEFANTRCDCCGEILIDSMETSGKAVGKR
jgi:ribosomal protein S27E